MKQFGVCNKKRFTLKIGEELQRFGTCDPKNTDARSIVFEAGKYWLVDHGADGAHPEIARVELPDNALVTNGYYDHEHDGWKTLPEFVGGTTDDIGYL